MSPATPTVAILLGPYRNLSTLTAALLHLHPGVQALNHGGWRVLGQSELDFFVTPRAEVLARFVDFALQASQGGLPGDYGGSILLSHAFESEAMKDAYVRRFGERRIKDRVDCLVWKESLRIGVHLRHHAVDTAGLFSALPSVRFLLPVRHPLDTALSNLRSGHWSLFPQLTMSPGAKHLGAAAVRVGPTPEQVLRVVLEEIRWFAAIEHLHPEHCLHFFQTDLDRGCLQAVARFLALDPERRWLDDAQGCLQLKALEPHSPELVRTYSRMVDELFANEPSYREGLLRFTEREEKGRE